MQYFNIQFSVNGSTNTRNIAEGTRLQDILSDQNSFKADNGIPANALLVVNGVDQDGSYLLRSGDVISFRQPASTKG